MLVLPLERKFKSAGMIGSFRRDILILLAVPYITINVPNMIVAIQKRLMIKMRTRYIKESAKRFNINV